MPTPEEMLAKSEAAHAEAKRKGQAAIRQAAKEKRERIAANIKRAEAWIRVVDFQMTKVGAATNVRVHVNTDDSWSKRKEWEPALQTVVDHYVAQGFKAEYKIENQMVWHGDGAGPGNDHHYIIVDWTPDAQS